MAFITSHSPVLTMLLKPVNTDIGDSNTGKNNGFPFLDILGYLKNTHKNPKFGKVRQVPTREFQPSSLIGTCLTLPNLGFLWESVIFFLCKCIKRWQQLAKVSCLVKKLSLVI